MNYPLISEYIEAIKSAEDSFEELSYLRPVLGGDGLPVMTSGNFAVVFKMKDEQSGKFYAVKCFTKEQEGRAEAYREIAKELENVSSPYILSIRYLDKELFVDTDQTTETEFPVLLMDWVEGKTLDKYLRENLDDKYALEMLAYRFCQLAQWLIPQPFAHGDLKPDNILVREAGTLVLVDYDGMYVPAMSGQKARELGSPNFRHPQRTEDDFDEHIDDFPLVSILLSLKAISCNPQLLDQYGAADRLLLSDNDYRNIDTSVFLKTNFPSNNEDLNILYSLFLLSNYVDSFTFSKHLLSLLYPTFCAPSRIKVSYNGEELNMVFVKGGTFLMGAQSENPSLPNYDKDAKKEDGPVRKVKVNDFWISETLVPMEMWPNCTKDMYIYYNEIVSERKHGKKDTLLFGAYGAPYEECEKFIDALNLDTLNLYRMMRFDFPTEEEWEYAARGGRKSLGYKYAGADDINEVAQYGMGVDGGLCALKQKKPNELGIFDMSGSLFEWCKGHETFDFTYDFKGVPAETICNYLRRYYGFFHQIIIRIKRGGSISSKPTECRITNRQIDLFHDDCFSGDAFEKVNLIDVITSSPSFDDSDFEDVYDCYEDESYSNQVGLRLVLRNLTLPQMKYSTIISKDDFDMTFVDEYGVIYSADKKRLLKGPTEQVKRGNHNWTKGVLGGSYSVRPGTVSICDKAFYNCKDLTAVILPQSVKEIGNKSFYSCMNLVSINMNEGLVKIGDDAFRDCKQLHSIHLPESIKSVGKNAFAGCAIKIVYSNYCE